MCERCDDIADDSIAIARGEGVTFERMCHYLPTVIEALGFENRPINLIPIIFSKKNNQGTNIIVILDDEGTHVVDLAALDMEIQNELVH